jgi:hypothetical protein
MNTEKLELEMASRFAYFQVELIITSRIRKVWKTTRSTFYATASDNDKGQDLVEE